MMAGKIKKINNKTSVTTMREDSDQTVNSRIEILKVALI